MRSRYFLTPRALAGETPRGLATIAFLAALLVGCATKAPLQYADPEFQASRPTNPTSASAPSGDRGTEREPDETYETSPVEESSDTVQGPSDLAAGEPAESSWRPQFELDFVIGLPQGAFADQVDDLGLGFSLLGGVGLPDWPVVLGAEFCFLNYGSKSDTEIIRTSIDHIEADVNTSNDIVMGHLLLRIQPRSGWLRPYLDALFGFKYFSTDTRITVPYFVPDDPFGTATIASKTQVDDTALSYGVGGGLDIRLKEWTNAKGGGTEVRANLGARYLFGSEAKYLKEGSIRRADGAVEFDILRSRTDMLIIQIGFAVEF
jgi:hypothetical protein